MVVMLRKLRLERRSKMNDKDRPMGKKQRRTAEAYYNSLVRYAKITALTLAGEVVRRLEDNKKETE